PCSGIGSVRPLPTSASPMPFAMAQSGDLPISGDFDGDGKADLAVWNPSTATFTIQQSTLGPFQRQLDTAGNERPAVADYDGDGKTDLAVYNTDFGYFLAILSSGRTVLEGLGVVDGIPVPADYDGDTKADFAVFNQPSATWTVRRSSDGAMLSDPRNGNMPVQF